LPRFEPILNQPHAISSIHDVIREIKRSRLAAERLLDLWRDKQPALYEIALIYQAYENWCATHGWADSEAIAEGAIQALGRKAVNPGWSLCAFDGFGQLDELQLQMISLLSSHVDELLITLTGDPDGGPCRMAHRRFQRARRLLETRLGFSAEPLPDLEPPRSTPTPTHALAYLEQTLFRLDPTTIPASQAVTFLTATNQAHEIREALRWLKARLVRDHLEPAQVALLTRDLAAYRPYLQEVADEFGLPLRLATPEPLDKNPVIAALLALLALPWQDWPWREVVEAWRCPYLNWAEIMPDKGDGEETAMEDAELLSAVAQWGQVIAGKQQWEEALQQLSRASQSEIATEAKALGRHAQLTPERTAQLYKRWQAFIRLLTPPEKARLSEYAHWVEALVGEDDQEQTPGAGQLADQSLHVLTRVRAATTHPGLCKRDEAALRAFKEILRGLVFAQVTLDERTPVSYKRFWQELDSAVKSQRYEALPVDQRGEAILAADAFHARGLSFEAVALVGLAEGVFPLPQRQDPFLSDPIRQDLAEALPTFEHHSESDEPSLFYEAVTRARQRLLLTRPRLAEDGAIWEPSPYWEMALDLFDPATNSVTQIQAGQVGQTTEVASKAEYLLALADKEWPGSWPDGERWERDRRALETGAQVWNARQNDLATAENGDLGALAPTTAERWGANHLWSASQLEAYGTCPHFFYAQYGLALEERQAPTEGMDMAQLGTIYHHLLAQTYQKAEAMTLAGLKAALTKVAPQVLAEAPERYGFRPTAWWSIRQEEIQQHVSETLDALADLDGDFRPRYFEVAFGRGGYPPLTLAGTDATPGEHDSIRLRGVIDRIDMNKDGELRVIDYKTFGRKYTIQALDLAQGRRLQLPIYALAAEEALGLGQAKDGFYWHIQSAEPSSLQLANILTPLETASQHVQTYVAAIRSGRFTPEPPADGCPSYCPSSAYCWRYTPKSW
jgi:ATP-dependent helicase/DNAse subunit B